MDFGQHDRVLATRNLTGVLCTAAGCWHSPLKDLNFCLKWITVDLLWEDLHGPLTLKTKLCFLCLCHFDECLDNNVPTQTFCQTRANQPVGSVSETFLHQGRSGGCGGGSPGGRLIIHPWTDQRYRQSS